MKTILPKTICLAIGLLISAVAGVLFTNGYGKTTNKSAPIACTFAQSFTLPQSQLSLRADSMMVSKDLHPGHPAAVLYNYKPGAQGQCYVALRMWAQNMGDEPLDIGQNISGSLYDATRTAYALDWVLENETGDSLIDSDRAVLPPHSGRTAIAYVLLPQTVPLQGGMVIEMQCAEQCYAFDISAYRLQAMRLRQGESIAYGGDISENAADQTSLTLEFAEYTNQLSPSAPRGNYTVYETPDGQALVHVFITLSHTSKQYDQVPIVSLVREGIETPLVLYPESEDGRKLIETTNAAETSKRLHYVLSVNADEAASGNPAQLYIHTAGAGYSTTTASLSAE